MKHIFTRVSKESVPCGGELNESKANVVVGHVGPASEDDEQRKEVRNNQLMGHVTFFEEHHRPEFIKGGSFFPKANDASGIRILASNFVYGIGGGIHPDALQSNKLYRLWFLGLVKVVASCPSCFYDEGTLKKKLTGPNFIDWYRNLRIVLSVEDKLPFLEQPIPALPVPSAGQVTPPDVLATHSAWVKASKEIAGLMLINMDPEIQKTLEYLGAFDMLKELKTLHVQQADQELL
ncbi:hypothetical protein Tco_0656876 [Tanacetum coccineum]|uniref:Zinc finger, CCHC-type n=1 Tax=Tanacetum coccineum TaxID=301880 RepID=A0ABQ4XAF9_9ASTR